MISLSDLPYYYYTLIIISPYQGCDISQKLKKIIVISSKRYKLIREQNLHRLHSIQNLTFKYRLKKKVGLLLGRTATYWEKCYFIVDIKYYC